MRDQKQSGLSSIKKEQRITDTVASSPPPSPASLVATPPASPNLSDMSNNNIHDQIPYQLPPNLTNLNLAGSNITGNLPYSISTMLYLSYLTCAACCFFALEPVGPSELGTGGLAGSIPGPVLITLVWTVLMCFNGVSIHNQHHLLQLLHKCLKNRTLDSTKCLHALSLTVGSCYDQSIFVSNNVMSMYASLGELPTARKLFDEMPKRNAASYNTIISGYSRCGYVGVASGLFSAMLGCGYSPTQHAVAGILSALSTDIHYGAQLHAVGTKSGLLDMNAFVGTALLNLYGRNGYLNEVIRVFEDMPERSIVTWNSMLSLFGNYGYSGHCSFLLRELMRENVVLSECSVIGALSGCSSRQDLVWGELIHGLVIKTGLECEAPVANSLINMYAKCASTFLAEKMFGDLNILDVVSWNAIISAWAKSERPERSLQLFLRMSMNEILPNQTTFTTVISSCTSSNDLIYGKFLHAKVIKNAYESDVYVGSSLVDFYSKCGDLDSACRSFDEICERNAVSWNALISAHATDGSSSAIMIFHKMLELRNRPNEFTFSAVLKAVMSLELLQLHCLIIKMGYECNEYVLSSLITSYARNGLVSDALAFVSDTELTVVPTNSIAGVYIRSGQYIEAVKLLFELDQPDLVSWNIVIAACARSGDDHLEEVFDLFKHMHMVGIQPDKYTMVSLLSTCSRSSKLALGSSVHGLIIKTAFNQYDTIVWNILMDMYGKCGMIGSTVKVFEEIPVRNIITWTVLISALGKNGRASEALERYREMDLIGFKPDGVLLNAVLSACRHGGLVREGMELFRQMKSYYKVEPAMDHYHCMVDLLARNGQLKEAEEMINSMPFPPNARIWRSFLEGCKKKDEIFGPQN